MKRKRQGTEKKVELQRKERNEMEKANKKGSFMGLLPLVIFLEFPADDRDFSGVCYFAVYEEPGCGREIIYGKSRNVLQGRGRRYPHSDGNYLHAGRRFLRSGKRDARDGYGNQYRYIDSTH